LSEEARATADATQTDGRQISHVDWKVKKCHRCDGQLFTHI